MTLVSVKKRKRMISKPTLWVQQQHNTSHYAFDFCYHAAMGARTMGHHVKTFRHHDAIPVVPTNIVVGSVEMCLGWLGKLDIEPTLVDLEPFRPYLRRSHDIWSMDDVRENIKWGKGPLFIKPARTIKAFTGFVVNDLLMLDVFSEGYNGEVIVQSPMEFVSEWRVYVNNNTIIGCKHYSGEHLLFPKRHFVNNVFNTAKEVLDYHSYTLDFGILTDGTTALIECNDGFAIGDYGLEPRTYYLFCRDRWLQLTGIRKRMDLHA